MRIKPWLRGAALTLGVSGCAQLHHVQIGDLDATQGKLVPFEVMASETGVSVGEAAAAAKVLAHVASGSAHAARAFSRDASFIADILAACQYGPSTGNVVFDDTYTDHLTGPSPRPARRAA